MRKMFSKSVLVTLMAFACFNVTLLSSCGNDAEKTTETTTTTTTTETTTPVVESAAPTDSNMNKAAAPADKMDSSAVQKPVEPSVKK